MEREWWLTDIGQNLLAGSYVDADNPILLDDEQILDFLRRIPAARESFNRLFPSMDSSSQERLTLLASLARPQTRDFTMYEDDFQRRMNTAGVRPMGPGPVKPGGR